MATSFSLVDERWIPCLLKGEGTTSELSLIEVFRRSGEVEAVVDPSPLVTASLIRLLLAILHRNFGPADEAEWQRLREAGGWDDSVLDSYLSAWRHRFDLFDVDRPFYQVPGLPQDSASSVAKVAHELNVANNPTVFDHSIYSAPPSFSPGQAARYLVATQAFAVGSLVSFRKGESRHRSARGAPLAKSVVLISTGSSLFETLLLNLHRYDGLNEEPFPFNPETDLPAWEREEPATPVDRIPDGYLDLLTWQSRQALFLPDEIDGEIIVQNAVIMKGCQLPTDYQLHGRETMVAFAHNPRAQRGQNPWPPLGFREERALWRDSLPLFRSLQQVRSRSKMVDWLSDLRESGAIGAGETLGLEAYGLRTDRAKLFAWRHERLTLPLDSLADEDFVIDLEEALAIAETGGRLLGSGWVTIPGEDSNVPSPIRDLASLLLAPASDDREQRQPHRGDIDNLVRALAPERRYWGRLDIPFREFLTDLTGGSAGALEAWIATVREAIESTFAETVDGLESSATELKAAALAERRLRWLLRVTIDLYLQKEGVA